MKQLLTSTLLFFSLSGIAQTVFFKSDQKFSKENLEDFYSAFTIEDSMILFKANDYSMYAYNKHTGKPMWKYYMRYKSNSRPYVAANYIWTNIGEVDGLRLDLNGTNPKKLPFSVYSKPHVKNNLVYVTGIYEAGNVLAYDLQADSIVWYQMIGHGCDRLPYYLEDRIIANAEGSRWLELGYDGSVLKKDCEKDEYGELKGESCYEEYLLRTHDGKKLTSKMADKIDLGEYSNPEFKTIKNKTIILYEGRLAILGKKVKLLFSKNLFELSEQIEEDNNQYSSLLKADDNKAWILYNDKLVIFNHKKKVIEKIVELDQWNIHHAVADADNLWFISKKDGLLYGVSISN